MNIRLTKCLLTVLASSPQVFRAGLVSWKKADVRLRFFTRHGSRKRSSLLASGIGSLVESMNEVNLRLKSIVCFWCLPWACSKTLAPVCQEIKHFRITFSFTNVELQRGAIHTCNAYAQPHTHQSLSLWRNGVFLVSFRWSQFSNLFIDWPLYHHPHPQCAAWERTVSSNPQLSYWV